MSWIRSSQATDPDGNSFWCSSRNRSKTVLLKSSSLFRRSGETWSLAMSRPPITVAKGVSAVTVANCLAKPLNWGPRTSAASDSASRSLSLSRCGSRTILTMPEVRARAASIAERPLGRPHSRSLQCPAVNRSFARTSSFGNSAKRWASSATMSTLPVGISFGESICQLALSRRKMHDHPASDRDQSRRSFVELSPILRQTVKTQFSFNGDLSHGIVSTEVHQRV